MRRLAVGAFVIAVMAAAVAGAATVAPPKAPVSISLPGDAGMVFKPGPGLAAAQASCLTCHSSAYVSTQPVLTRAQWTAEVVKMRTLYGAPITDDQVPAIVDYLTAQYGKP
jgi:mono/diheme cytochrome c family protein